VDARAALGEIAPASQCHQPSGFRIVIFSKRAGSLKLITESHIACHAALHRGYY
jgi:hypothetical protein